MRKSLLSHQELAFHVCVEDLIDVLAFDVWDVVEMLDAAIGHHNVDAAKLLNSRLKELSDRLRLRDVSFNADGTHTQAAALFSDCFSCLWGGVVIDYDIYAMRCKASHNGGTNTSPRTGDWAGQNNTVSPRRHSLSLPSATLPVRLLTCVAIA